MNQLEVPKLYKCFLTGEIMSDPVVAVQRAEIYDRSSLSKIFKGKTQEKLVLPLPGLKTAIQQYCSMYSQLCNNSNQPEEVTEIEQLEESATDSSSTNSVATLQNYEKKVEEIKQEFKVVSDAFKKTEKQSVCLRAEAKNLKDQSAIIQTIAKKIADINVYSGMKDSQKLRKSLVGSQKSINLVVDSGVQVLAGFCENKYLFEQKLLRLEKMEEQLANLQENLSNTLKNLGIEPRYKAQFEGSSKQFREYPTIDQNQFVQLVKSGNVSFKNVLIKSEERNIDVEVNGQVVLQDLVINNTSNGTYYIRLIISDPRTNVAIHNCKFSCIGLELYCALNTFCGDIALRNTEVKNAPGLGIDIQCCKKCSFENVKVDGCGYTGIWLHVNESNLEDVHVQKCGKNGIWLHVNESSLEDVHVQNCGKNGIYIYRIAKPVNMRNCSFRNCKVYGIYNVSSGTVNAENVTFK